MAMLSLVCRMIQWEPTMNRHPLKLPWLLTACSQAQILTKFHRNVYEYITNSHLFVRKNHYQNMTELAACEVHNQLQASGVWAMLFLGTWKHHWQADMNLKKEFWWRWYWLTRYNLHTTDLSKTPPNSTANFNSWNVCQFGDVKTHVSGVPTNDQRFLKEIFTRKPMSQIHLYHSIHISFLTNIIYSGLGWI